MQSELHELMVASKKEESIIFFYLIGMFLTVFAVVVGNVCLQNTLTRLEKLPRVMA